MSLSRPQGLAVSPTGAIYVADSGHHCVRRLDPASGLMTTVAGVGIPGYSGDGGRATDAQLRGCGAVALAPDGSLYIADSDNHCLRRVTPAGVITTVAGGGPIQPGHLSPIGDPDVPYWNVGMVHLGGDDGPATAARLHLPLDVAVGPDGAIYVADTGNDRIRRVDHRGIITTVAGGGPPGAAGDGGLATQAWLVLPQGVVVGPDGLLVIADSGNHRIRRVDQAGRITTVAGTGTHGFSGDGGPALSARLHDPWRVALMPDGTLVIADSGNGRLRQVTSEGRISTIAGVGPATTAGSPSLTGSVTE